MKETFEEDSVERVTTRKKESVTSIFREKRNGKNLGWKCTGVMVPGN